MNQRTTASILLAGLLAAGSAFAQTTDVPMKGQESTMTNGQPNMATTNNPAVENPATAPSIVVVPVAPAIAVAPSDTVVVPSDTAVVTPAPAAATMGAAGADGVAGYVTVPGDGARTYDVPVTGGEASTMTRGQPNVSTNNHTPDGSVRHAARTYPVLVDRSPEGEASTMVGGQPNANPDAPLMR